MRSKSRSRLWGYVLTGLFGIVVVIIIIQMSNSDNTEEKSNNGLREVLPTVVDTVEKPQAQVRTIGTSVEGRKIEVYTFGNGEKHLLFVGGVHGGYEWNSVFLSYKFIDYLKDHNDFVPQDMTIAIVPSANPDGLAKVTGKTGRFSLEDIPKKKNTTGIGRFNAHKVDLNRNFACKWKPKSTWRGNVVSAGSEAFSEPEAQAIRNLVSTYKPQSVVFWHSQAGAVYASECKDGVLPGTKAIMNTYAEAAGYRAVESFDAYEVTGDSEGWLASIGIPAITVELTTHDTVEWEKNLSGIKAVIQYYSQQ